MKIVLKNDQKLPKRIDMNENGAEKWNWTSTVSHQIHTIVNCISINIVYPCVYRKCVQCVVIVTFILCVTVFFVYQLSTFRVLL